MGLIDKDFNEMRERIQQLESENKAKDEEIAALKVANKAKDKEIAELKKQVSEYLTDIVGDDCDDFG